MTNKKNLVKSKKVNKVKKKKIVSNKKKYSAKAEKCTKIEKDEMFSGSIFDSTEGNTDALFVNQPKEPETPTIQVIIPEAQSTNEQKKPWWKRFFVKK